ncbi:MAG: hypothetical protein HY696_02595 [Deltaproteobacteria bacterium]|nr:hypothetical protein [Deltaproteobacteria bacterium]
MRYARLGALWFSLILFTLTGCIFAPSRGPRILSVRHDTVFLTDHRAFTVGALPTPWQRYRTRASGLTFRHGPTGAMLTLHTGCGGSFEDIPLKNLMGGLFGGLPLERELGDQMFSLDGREAYRSRTVRRIDGVPVYCEAVVVKKNNCSFDFILTAPEATAAHVRPSFDTFVRGFHFE